MRYMPSWHGPSRRRSIIPSECLGVDTVIRILLRSTRNLQSKGIECTRDTRQVSVKPAIIVELSTFVRRFLIWILSHEICTVWYPSVVHYPCKWHGTMRRYCRTSQHQVQMVRLVLLRVLTSLGCRYYTRMAQCTSLLSCFK